MREIAFKAKRIDNGEWVEGFYIKKYDGTGKSRHYIYISKGCIVWEYAEVDANTICQYTGLTDKYGNKIWENNVVKRYNANGDEWKISKIVWADHSLNMGWCIEDVKSLTEYSNRLFKVGFDVNDTEKCEVIGNIFDNPELLEGGAE